MKSIYLRNFIATAAMIGLSLLLVAVSIFLLGRNYIVEDYVSTMRGSAYEVAHLASAVAEDDSLNSWMLGMNLSSISKATGNHIFVADSSGVVVSCCDELPMCSHLGKSIPEDILSVIQQNGTYQGKTLLSGFYPEERILVAVPVVSETGPLGYVGVSVLQKNIYSPWKTFLTIMILASAAVFTAILIFAYVYSKRMAKPLDKIAEASRSFARGDFSVRVPQDSDTSYEMGALIDSFNKMADSLENAEKRRTEFISNISHELRTPMTTISGFADGILDGTIPKEEEEKYLRSIRDETRRLSRLVRSMLDASKMKSMASDPKRRTTFDLTELVLQTLLSFETRATEKNLDVDPQFPDNRLMVRADKDAITQVIYNLLDNAVKFARPGSCITVRLYIEDKKAFVSVKDEGETIPPDDLPYIFDRFHKSDRSRSLDKDGVGLGLYLVKTIINSHDEDIAVKSEDGVTEFVFTLPLAE
ncbi:MAG: HAMP domain-containing histidine kinase [Oscillospiraceae bacterium]|nr:HAMP domain-containing histidine kinase [Oscillospiraceae bacterium]